jgi:hypothetical protein
MLLRHPPPDTRGKKRAVLVEDRRKLKSFRMDFTEEELGVLDKLVEQTGTRTRTRFIRWLIRTWAEVEKRGTEAPSWEEDPTVKLALLRQGRARSIEVQVDPWQGEYEDAPVPEAVPPLGSVLDLGEGLGPVLPERGPRGRFRRG